MKTRRRAVRTRAAAAWLVAAAFLLGPDAIAADDGEPEDPTPAAVVGAYHAALHAGDKIRALALLSAQLIVFEDGRSEESRGEYASHHLETDIEFSRHTDRTVLKQLERAGERQAWVLSWVRVKGTARGVPVDRRLLETILLAREQGSWKITHIHWSEAGH